MAPRYEDSSDWLQGDLRSLLGAELLHKGHEVTSRDTGFYREGAFYPADGTTPATVTKGIRRIAARSYGAMRSST